MERESSSAYGAVIVNGDRGIFTHESLSGRFPLANLRYAIMVRIIHSLRRSTWGLPYLYHIGRTVAKVIGSDR